jgi:DNA recombination protein RmuC
MGDMGTILLITVVAVAAGAVTATFVFGRRPGVHEAERAEGFARLEGELSAQSAEVRRLADALAFADGERARMGTDLSEARRLVQTMALRDDERREREADLQGVVRRISTLLAGGGKKGRAGENLLRERLSALPPGMLETDFRVNGRTVEFALRLPDGRRLPVDSKWSGDAELELLESAEDPSEIARLSREVEKIVTARVREVAAYLDPGLTSSMAVAAVPDPAYEVITRAHADAFARSVVVIPYSSALPILLFLYSLVSRYGDAGDVTAALADIANLMTHVETTLENKIARATTMIQNGAEEIRVDLGKAQGTLAKARASEGEAGPGEKVELRAVGFDL